MPENLDPQKKMEALAHDLNNVLSNILSSIKLLKQKEELPSRQKFLINNIENDSVRAAEMLENALNRQPAKRKINPNNLIADLTGSIRATFPQNITLREKLSPEIKSFFGIYTDIYRSFFNLLINSKEALPEGGEIVIESSNIVLEGNNPGEYGNLPGGNYIQIKVIDTGEGIDEESISKLFSENFSTKNKNRKSGIGLKSVKELIENHNGNIRVESKVGEGTEFSILLPSFEEQKGDNKSTNKFTVMITEDDEKLRNLIDELLSSYGYNVITANSGRQSLEVLRNKNKIDLIIIDRKMPGMNGLECIENIRELNSDIPIILSSGSPAKDTDSLIDKLSINCVLNKPYNFESLIEQIDKLLL